MGEWKEYRLGEIADCTLGKMLDQKKNKGIPRTYIGNVAVRWGTFKIDPTQKMLIENGEVERYELKKGDIVICEGGEPGRCAIWEEDSQMFIQKALHRVRVKENLANNYFVYYSFRNFVQQGKVEPYLTGSTIKHLPRERLVSLKIPLPPLTKQTEIVSILKSLDDKIEVNRRINENLEAQAQALFKSWFVDFEPFRDGEFVESELGMIPKGWRVGSLSDIAEYINGLAMQKFRPEEGEKGLPVLKIKELGQGGFDDNSELCSPSLIGKKYIINDGDIIFSWSGTLMVKIWCGGKCGLNQHLFIVAPKKTPKWFVYQWTQYHLDNFIRIAKDKAVTMGHIKRGELDKAKVSIPDEENMEKINFLMEPIFNQIISNELESRRLATLRDTLLPRLMSGEIKVGDVTL